MSTEPLELAVPPPPSEERGYTIAIQPGLLEVAGERLADWVSPGPLALVSEEAILALHGAGLLGSLRAAGFDPRVHTIPGGEGCKTLETTGEVYRFLARQTLERGAPLLAFGGGVVGDLAGFAAATWKRGVPFVQVPTTLLSMVDSSVGGKTAVDLPAGKNLVGAFKQPAGVLIDPALLETLPTAERRAGLAEVVKHGQIGAPALFERLERAPLPEAPAGWATLVAEAVAVKLEVVREDPFERGRRAVLNLGHTFGHAFERCAGYRIRHGEAVAVGLVAAAELGVRLGLSEPALLVRTRACLERLGLPTAFPELSPGDVRAAMQQDKKRRDQRLRFVVARSLGDVVLVDDPGEPVDEALRAVCG